MNPISMAGAFIMTMSLLAYGLGSISLLQFKVVSPGVLLFFTIGVSLNIVSIALMIVAFNGIPFSIHSIWGCSAFLVMFVDVMLIWRLYLKGKINAPVGEKFLLYSKIAYVWWLVFYLAGSLLVIWL